VKAQAAKTDQNLTIDQTWELFHKTRGSQYRNLLMEHYRDLVRYAAERLHAKLPDKVELDDLISAGTFGLMDAIDAYDPARGVKFETYCAPRIKGSILDELRSMDWVPRLVRARRHQLAKATHALEIRLGRKPDERELAKGLDMDMEEFGRLQRDANAASLVSLNNKSGDAEGEKDVYLIDAIKDHLSEDPLLEAQKRDLKNLLTKGLTRAERLIIVLYYYEEMTMKEIGAQLDLSESRVSQMHSSIVARLKAQMNTRKKELQREEPEGKEVARGAGKPHQAARGQEEKLVIRVCVDEYVDDDALVEGITELYRALNRYHILCGGSGLTIGDWQIRVRAGAPKGVLV